ncbi:hypothetical protein [Leptolyngbya sp. 7M]|uniref:hypothetical protein n=1 Tax=Leptolyngbya sp. 7M TaxID=2812896 RepID=UPI001B8C0B3C|nr:hypothetical protein [Leptolyngbya sp. 7M]QYO63801.1 hypothetical protein JVX88_28855 [Leptolyngbya sp. 7M]
MGNQTEFLVGSGIQLYWSTENAVSCSLQLNGVTIAQNLSANVDASQGYPVTVPLVAEAAQYMLYAYDTTGEYTASLQLTVSVFQFKLLPNPIGNLTKHASQTVLRTDGTLYVAGSGLDVVSTATNTVIHSIQWPNYEQATQLTGNSMVMSPDESQLYVLIANNYSLTNSQIQVVNLSNYQVQSISVPWYLGTIAIGAYNGKPCLVVTDLALDGDNMYSSYIYVLDPSNNYGLIQKFALPSLSMFISSAVASPQGDRISLCGTYGNTMTDPTGTTLCTYTIASNTLSEFYFPNTCIFPGNTFAFSAVSRRYYLGCYRPNAGNNQPEITVIDANTNQIVDTIIPSSDPHIVFPLITSLVLSPDGLHLYAQLLTIDTDRSISDTIVRINLNTFQVVGTLVSPNVRFSAWAVKPDGTCLYGVAGDEVSTLYLFEISDGLNALRESSAVD